MVTGDSAPFSPAARAVLEKAGWTEGYVFPALEEHCRVLAAEGYEVSGAARDFLRRFGGLDFDVPLPSRPSVRESFHTRAADAASMVFPETAEGWGEIVGAPVCLVGGVYGDHMILSMDAAGRVFAGEGILVVQVGGSGVEAIENLCTGAGYPWPRIGYPYDDVEPAGTVRRPAPSSFWERLWTFFTPWER